MGKREDICAVKGERVVKAEHVVKAGIATRAKVMFSYAIS